MFNHNVCTRFLGLRYVTESQALSGPLRCPVSHSLVSEEFEPPTPVSDLKERREERRTFVEPGTREGD